MISLGALSVGAGVGFIAGAWDRIQGFFANIIGLVIKSIHFRGKAGYACLAYLARYGKPVFVTTWNVIGTSLYVRPRNKSQLVAFRIPPLDITVYYKLGKTIITVRREWGIIKIACLRGTLDFDKLTADITENFNTSMCDDGGRRFFIRRMYGTLGEKPLVNMGGDNAKAVSTSMDDDHIPIDKFSGTPFMWKVKDIGEPQRDVAIAVLELTDAVKSACDYVGVWLARRDWFLKRGIPWRLSYVFGGIPGGGKTAAAGAIGQQYDLPIFTFELATMTNKDLIEAWQEIMSWTPCIALFEDMHTIFEYDERILNTGQEAGISIGTLLNVLDGVSRTDGVLSILTTNNLDTLSIALGGLDADGKRHLRPGRVNRVLEFVPLTLDQRHHMATRILNDLLDDPAIHKLAGEHDGATGAQFQDVCAILAQTLIDAVEKEKEKEYKTADGK